MSIVVGAVTFVVAAGIGILGGYAMRKNSAEKKIGSAEIKAKNILLDAENEKKNIKKAAEIDAKEIAQKIAREAEKEARGIRASAQQIEERIIKKEEGLDRKLDEVAKSRDALSAQEREIEKEKAALSKFREKKIAELERVSGHTKDQAKEELLNEVEQDIRKEVGEKIKEIETEALSEADKKAKEIIATAVQRCASDYIVENTVSVVALPNDDMKGRIIGREGRNIRAIENATGIDVIIDDTPEAVVLSGFDSVRREIAKKAIEKLIIDGRIHPARIEEMVEKSRKEIEKEMKDEGEKALYEVGVYKLHPELVKLLGKLKFRTSYGQNVLKHSIEVAHLAGMMASELGFDPMVAKRAGLLHDIGKAVDQEQEGTHVELGVELLKKYKEKQSIIDGMISHHGDYEHRSIEAILVTAADALSAARPGARRETLETYIKRLQQLEEIANTTEGVDSSFAVQAGREIRIIVQPDKVSDEEIAVLARDVSKRIESELQYPGQIKVNVMREVRAVDYAK